jgi:hypothetical protein
MSVFILNQLWQYIFWAKIFSYNWSQKSAVQDKKMLMAGFAASLSEAG